MRALFTALLAAVLAPLAMLSVPLTAQDSLPPAPYAYTQLEDPALEAQAVELMATLRCLTCQSQNIHDSDAPMAGDMRHQVRSRLAAGEEPEAIRQWLIVRYGDYVSYQPEVSSTTWPLFLVPAIIFGFGFLLLFRRLGRKRSDGDEADSAPTSEENA